MGLKKKIFLLLLIIGVIFIYKTFQKNIDSSIKLPVVAITQIIEHPSLDQEYQGILQGLEEAGFIDNKTVKIYYQNAQGNIATATQIVKQMITYDPKVLVAISTPSTQVALSPCQENKIPLIFTAVTDPVAAKIIKSLNEKSNSCTGVSDQLPVKSQFELIKIFLPNIEKLGVIYNAGEINSVNMVTLLQEEAQKFNINIVCATVNKTSEVSAAANSLVGKVQAIYLPNDNTVIAAVNSAVQVGEQNRLPVFAGDVGAVQRGALAARGYDRISLGKAAGEMIAKILKGSHTIKDLPIINNHSLQTFLNKEAAEKMGIEIPSSILEKSIIIKG